jgi:hypothetical protein
MKLCIAAIAAFLAMHRSVDGFAPAPSTRTLSTTSPLRMGYLDDLSPIPNPNIEEEVDDSHEATKMKKEDIDRAGPGSWESYVEFNEFDGGDGQMGVAGDGKASLEKFDMSEMAKSKAMSAKNAWGKSTGYADSLVAKGVDTARAQQLENWLNQQELQQQRKNQRYMTEDFDKPGAGEEDWRKLASFGIERNQDFDLDKTFGAVSASANIEGTIELVGRMNGPYATHEFTLRVRDDRFIGVEYSLHQSDG